MNKIFLFLLLSISLISCKKISPSQDDEIAIQKILDVYGGNIETIKSVGNIEGKSFEIQIKESKIIENQPNKAITVSYTHLDVYKRQEK